MSNRDPYGVKTSETTMDCNNRTVQIKTNQTPDSYMHITVKCDVKCSLAQQMAYKRLMERQGDEKYTLLDDYYARAKRIAATYARFCLETEDGCDKQLQGRYYWMGLGAFASKTVACMLNSVQIKLTILDFGLIMSSGYEGLAKGNFWLFQDVASWHFLYNMSVTKGKGYEGFVQCQNIKSADILCETPKNIVKNKLPWAEEALPLIGNLAKTTGRPQAGTLEEGMGLVHKIEMMILANEKEKYIRKKQFKHLLAIAKHEQGNILQPLIYEDPSNGIDFQDMITLMRHLPWMPEVKLTFTSDCDESQEKVNDLEKERQDKSFSSYAQALKKEEGRIRHEILKEHGLGVLDDKALRTEISRRMESENVYGKIKMPNSDKSKIEDIVSKPKDGDNIVLEDYRIRMVWIRNAAQKYHDLWGSNPKYMKSELTRIALWVDIEDRFDWTITKKY